MSLILGLAGGVLTAYALWVGYGILQLSGLSLDPAALMNQLAHDPAMLVNQLVLPGAMLIPGLLLLGASEALAALSDMKVMLRRIAEKS